MGLSCKFPLKVRKCHCDPRHLFGETYRRYKLNQALEIKKINYLTTQKPKISRATIKRWQRIVDLIAQLSKTPAGLIMRLDVGQSINVFVTSATDGNVWNLGDKCALNSGLYCEEVIKTCDRLVVPDALRDPKWNRNPDLEFGMSFYLGYPLVWPDGEIFGTICVLDTKTNSTAMNYQELIFQFKQVVDSDLNMLVEIAQRKRAQSELIEIQKELELRVRKRTAELRKTNRGLEQEITRRKISESTLRQREADLEEKSRNLEDTNTALRILLENRESAKEQLETSMLANINELIIPYLRKMRNSTEPSEWKQYLDLIGMSLRDITSSFSGKLVQKYANLTATEIQVINLIRQGKKTKEIARFLNTAPSTIDFHRNNIRKKIGLTNRRTSLHAHFLSASSVI